MNIDVLIAKLERAKEEKQNRIIWAACALADMPEENTQPILNVIEEAQYVNMQRAFKLNKEKE